MLKPSVAAPLAVVDWFRIGHLYQIYSYSYSFLEIQIGISKGTLHLPWVEGFCNVGTQKHSVVGCLTLKIRELDKALLQGVKKRISYKCK